MNLKNLLQYHIRIIDRVKVKGKSQVITVYEVFDADSPATIELKLKTLHNFEQGFMCFHHNQFEKAFQFFEQVLQAHEDDKAARVYWARCRSYLNLSI